MKRVMLGLLPLLLALSATPAKADETGWTEKCYDGLGNDREVALPGKTDLNIFAKPCVYRSGSKVYAVVELLTAEASIPAVGSGHKFDGFLLTATLERHKNGQSADRDQILKLESCDYKDELNASWGRHLYCKTDVHTGYDSDYEYSADGWLQYDVDNDGKGRLPVMELTGSPVIH